MKYTSIRCPGKKNNRECNHILGGTAIDTLANYDFKKPFDEIRYCPNCNSFWKVTIKGEDLPVFIEKTLDRVDFVPIEDIFNASICLRRRGKA